ncbi:MAG TPA: LamG-like jellyroll fold domain-containing protein [Candidatus Limnocylindria bacterium]|nr:LamG-like jellyroll fold domain-containing protein [Candidatus Limnocylindria bacterium]
MQNQNQKEIIATHKRHPTVGGPVALRRLALHIAAENLFQYVKIPSFRHRPSIDLPFVWRVRLMFAVAALAFIGMGHSARGGSVPTATTLPATQTNGIAAYLNGTVAMGDGNPTVYFEYGQTTNYGSVTPAQMAGPFSYAISFNGAQSVRVANPQVPSGNQPYTIEAWIKPDSMGARGMIGWGTYGFDNQATAFRLHDNGLDSYWWGNDLVASTTNLANTWHHVATSFDGTTRVIYLDGVLRGSDTPGASHSVLSTNLTLGTTGFGENYSGLLGEVRVWSVAVSQGDLQQWMTRSVAPAHPNYANLAAYWPLSDQNISSITDASGKGNDGIPSTQLPYVPGVAPVRITGLTPGSTYHFRLVASNSFGVSIGADQTFTQRVSPVFVVENLNESGPGSLRQALFDATIAGVPDVVDASGITGTIRLQSPFFPLTNSIVINGPGTTNLTISGQGQNRIFFVDAVGGSVGINNLTLADGYARGSDGGVQAGGGAGLGGAMFVNRGAVTVSGVLFTNNAAVGGNGGRPVEVFGINCSGVGGGGGSGYPGVGGSGNDFIGGQGVCAKSGFGGDGGFGAGGGGGSTVGLTGDPNKGGNGGFGGGGGGSATLIRAPGGLYGGTSGSGIYGGLRTGGLARGAGGGGGALGGSVFVRGDTAASLVWVNSSASAGLLTPGGGAAVTFAVPSDGGSTAGSSLFLSSGPTTLEVPTGTNFIAGSIAGWGPDTTSVVKTGPGRLVLSGTNSYTGTTTVSDGTLEIDGDNSASTRLIVRAGGMLAGDGIVGPLTVNAGGVLFPGHGLGTLTVGNTVWNGPGTHILRLYDATGARGEGYNSLTVNGTLDLSSSSNLTVKISSQSDPDGTPGDALHFDNATRASWVLARATGGVRNFNPTGFTVVLAADETSSGFSNVIGAGTFVVGVSGNDLVLNFEPPRVPVAVALDVSNLSTNSATFNGTVNNFGFASSAWFEYGTTTNYGSVTAVVNVPGALGIPVSAAVAGLFPNTVYHYRLVASNSVASPSQDLTFMTRGLPEATTLAAGPVLSATAVLNGQVVSHGLPTVYYYRYGLTTNYGSVTPSGDATLSERALGFGGADSVQVPTPAVPSGNSQYTIEAWINPDAMGALGIIGWGNFGNTRQATALRLTDTGLDHYWWDMDLLSQTTNLTGSWHHVAASFDGTTRITYLDGVAVGSDQPNSDHFVPSANLALGVTGFGEWFRGRIGEKRVWSVAVDQAALQAWMIRPVGSGHPYYESLQARWPMTEGTGTYIADVTGHGNTGTLTGSGYWTNGPVFFNDLSAIQVSSGISGLLAATEYHFQLVASNALGVVYGSDVAFATPILAPSLAGVTAVSITSSNAVLQANPSPNGASTTFYFRHGLATNYTSASSPVILPDLNGVQPRSLVLENLAPGTVYHFQAVASNNVGITASKDMVFTTVPVAPSAITGTAIPLGPTTASLNGSTGTGGGATAVYFEYGPTVAYGSSVSTLISATPAIQTVSVTVAGLNPGGSYHFRTVVSNATATVGGGDVAFTMPLPPVAETLAATQVTGASATLNAQVDPAGADTTVYFIYGAPPSYGLISYAAQVSAKGGVQTVSVPVGGLATLSAYQVRVIASSVAGEVLGNETHFTTLASELSATTRPPYGVVSNSAAALGSITPGSEPFCWWYEYGINTNYESATIPRCGQTRAMRRIPLKPGLTRTPWERWVSSAGVILARSARRRPCASPIRA